MERRGFMKRGGMNGFRALSAEFVHGQEVSARLL
jgi:hypothetical protein